MLLVPEQRPLLSSEVEEAAIRYDALWHSQLQRFFRDTLNGSTDALTRFSLFVKKPEVPVPTMLLTDRYVEETIKFQYYRNMVISILLGIAIAVQNVKFIKNEQLPEEAYKLAGLLVIAILTSFPFSKLNETYEAFKDELETK